jgi:hypothetical protein
LQTRAAALRDRLVSRVGRDRVQENRGSYSLRDAGHRGVIAKIIIVEDQELQDLATGVYVLVSIGRDTSGLRTIYIAPGNWEYSYLRVLPDQDLDELADFLAAFSAPERVYYPEG